MTFFYKGGCLLPFLIILNLFFGRLFFSLRAWLIIEALLLLVFFLYSYILSKKILEGINSVKRKGSFVDVEGEVVQDKEGLNKERKVLGNGGD